MITRLVMKISWPHDLSWIETEMILNKRQPTRSGWTTLMTTRLVMNWYMKGAIESRRKNILDELCIIHNEWWMTHNSLRLCLLDSTCTEWSHDLHKLTRTTTQPHLTPCVFGAVRYQWVFTAPLLYSEWRPSITCIATPSLPPLPNAAFSVPAYG